VQKVRGAEDGWNNLQSGLVSLAYTPYSHWRNRSEFARGRVEIGRVPDPQMGEGAELSPDQEYGHSPGNRIAVRFAYEWHDDSGNWFRSYGNENWEFANDGLMQRRLASINDCPIKESERNSIGTVRGPALLTIPGFRNSGFSDPVAVQLRARARLRPAREVDPLLPLTTC